LPPIIKLKLKKEEKNKPPKGLRRKME
jgi:hypothetical protein